MIAISDVKNGLPSSLGVGNIGFGSAGPGSLGRMNSSRFSKPYERTHDVVENIESRFCYPTMSLKGQHLSHLSHDLVENTCFALPSVGLSGSRAALLCTIKVLEAS
jgi:hypothetical protein